MGEYVFDSVAAGTYRIVPAYDGYTFAPASIELQPGVYAPQISAADSFPSTGEGCRSVDFGGALANADLMSFNILSFGLSIADDARRLGEHGGRSERIEILRAVESAILRLNRSYGKIISLSRQLPTRAMTCDGRTTCVTKSYRLQVSRYRAWLDQLRKLSLFIMRTARERIGGDSFSDATVTTVRSLHRNALKAQRELPRATRQCL
jgi:hypothetical protein